nr:twin-arginine translocation signal domain-containing protein [Phycisphaerae bacterium]
MATSRNQKTRRDFLKHSVATAGVIGAGVSAAPVRAMAPANRKLTVDGSGVGGSTPGLRVGGKRAYNDWYRGETLSRVAFPMGGIGAGMICLEGTGAFSHFSTRNLPEVFNEPVLFAAICVKGQGGPESVTGRGDLGSRL